MHVGVQGLTPGTLDFILKLMSISATILLGISIPILVMETQSMEWSRDYLITAVQQQGVYLPSSQGLLPGLSSQATDRRAQDFPEYCSF